MAYPDTHQALIDRLREAATKTRQAREAMQAASSAMSAATAAGTPTGTSTGGVVGVKGR